MRKSLAVLCTGIFTVLIVAAASPASAASSFRSLSFGGATGLIATPTAQVGWDKGDVGLDFGYHYIDDESKEDTHIPKVTATLFQRWEIGAAYDIQDNDEDDASDNDLLLHTKFRFTKPGDSSAVAIGGNYQMLKTIITPEREEKSNIYQLYLAATYGGKFLGQTAETTVVVGKTFGETDNARGESQEVEDDNIDFSMGFDMDLVPSLFKGYVHWINDFSNYSYSYQPYGSNTWYRGAFNTGLRISPKMKYKFNIDAIVTDAFDHDRGFALGASFGMAF